MLRYLYRLALPGGRRLVLVYYPPKPTTKSDFVRVKQKPDPVFDRGLAQFGSGVVLPVDAGLPKALKNK